MLPVLIALEVLPGETDDPAVTREEALDHCRIPDLADPTLGGYLATAIAAASDICGELDGHAWRARWEGDFPDPGIVLPRPPVRSVVAVRYWLAGDAEDAPTTLPPEEYRLAVSLEPDGLQTLAVVKPVEEWPADAVAFEVEFLAGYGHDALPAPIRSGVLLFTAELYERREQAAPGPVLHAVPITAEKLWNRFRLYWFPQ